MNKKVVGTIVVIIIVAAGSFYGGMTYQKSKIPARSSFAAQFGGAGRTGVRTGSTVSTGQIIATGNGTITIKVQSSGSDQIILVNSSTPIMKSTSGTFADLAVGTSVVVSGSANADGSMTAQSIQIRPAGASTPPTQPTQ